MLISYAIRNLCSWSSVISFALKLILKIAHDSLFQYNKLNTLN